ncbi:zinc ribbon domain-containing protein [Halomonas sp. GFAJ-1]|uniref:zinc ribbon domain-containing protein n=1 Tax=Halomonas sp. GFAJ-1 TaxID=1118153 RepID=UPI00192D14F2|nr:zinc ribbon domain-containing protein [Halomonas sp. GFAJ-1]
MICACEISCFFRLQNSTYQRDYFSGGLPGHKVEKLPLSQRHWHCEGCGEAIGRDINAANNIRTAGLAGFACGATGAGAAA